MNHSEAWELIPWFVNGRASTEQCTRLEQHLGHCGECRAELAAQRELMLAMQTRPNVESMPHASLQKLWARIDGEPPVAALPDVPRRRPNLGGWLAAAVVVQALLLGVLSMALLGSRGSAHEEGGTYRTVSAPPAAGGLPAARAVFAPEMTLGQLRALLERAHLRIVNGPTAEGVLTLALATPADDAGQALAILRADPAARFAEPVGR